jgi:hypothetical protein
MASAGALQEGALQERRVGGPPVLLRLGRLSAEEVLGAPGILVVRTNNYEAITGRSDGSARLFLVKREF